MTERRKVTPDTTQIKKALEHVAASSDIVWSILHSAFGWWKIEKNARRSGGFTESDILAYTRIKLGGTSSTKDKRRDVRLRKKLAKLDL